MSFTVVRPGLPPLSVDADEHRLEGGWHVFRRDTVVLGRPRSVVALRLPAHEVRQVDEVIEAAVDGSPEPEDAPAMTRRFAVPLEQLEAQARVAATDQQEVQAVPRLDEPLLAGPHVHPYGDGATGPDGDGD